MRTRRLTPYGFLLPTLLFLGVVFGYAVVAVVLESFRVPGLLGVTSWGVTNYHDVVHDSLFWQSLLDNLKLFLAIPVMTIVGLLMAVLLHERAKGWRIYRSLAFLPYVLAVPVVGVVFSYILERNGVLNDMLNTLHLHFLVHDWLGNPSLALWSIALSSPGSRPAWRSCCSSPGSPAWTRASTRRRWSTAQAGPGGTGTSRCRS